MKNKMTELIDSHNTYNLFCLDKYHNTQIILNLNVFFSLLIFKDGHNHSI